MDGDNLKCSFCAKRQDQVEVLIAGPGVAICTECVDFCNEIIAGKAVYAAAGPGSGSSGCVIALDGTTPCLEGRFAQRASLPVRRSAGVPGCPGVTVSSRR